MVTGAITIIDPSRNPDIAVPIDLPSFLLCDTQQDHPKIAGPKNRMFGRTTANKPRRIPVLKERQNVKPSHQRRRMSISNKLRVTSRTGASNSPSKKIKTQYTDIKAANNSPIMRLNKAFPKKYAKIQLPNPNSIWIILGAR
jgi:hypothetical protein